MARERMVTRTITKNTLECMVVNTTNQTVKTVNYPYTGNMDDKNLLKKVQKLYNTTTEMIVTITGSTVQEELYGMTELEFMQHARLLPPRSTKDESES